MKTRRAYFVSKQDANACIDSISQRSALLSISLQVIPERDGYSISASILSSSRFPNGASGYVRVNSESDMFAFFEFTSWDSDLTSGEEICSHVDLDGRILPSSPGVVPR